MLVPPVESSTPKAWGAGWGFFAGAALTLVALFSLPEQASDKQGIGFWLSTNLGLSIWPFTAITILFTIELRRLQLLLADPSAWQRQSNGIIALEQMLDVWTQVFIGVGVIWTAIGMRSALQYTLGEPQMVLSDDAGNVLRKLVDGGILLALSTTIVGAVGGYLMRLIKTLSIGVALQNFHEHIERQDIGALLEATQRIERHLAKLGDEPEPAPVTPIQQGHRS